MFNFINKVILSKYNSMDYIDKQRGRLFFILNSVLIAIIPITLLLYYLLNRMNIVIFSLLIVLCIILSFNQLIVKRGKFYISGHVFLLSLLTLVWAIIIFDTEKHLISQLDSAIYPFSFLFIVPLIINKFRRSIIFYFLYNYFFFAIFALRIKFQFNLSTNVFAGYILDNSIAYFLMATFSFQIYNIFKSALDQAKISEAEVNNQNLILQDSRYHLEKSEKKYRLIYENALMGMVTLNLTEGKIHKANKTAVNLLGYKGSDNLLYTIALDDLFPSKEVKKVFFMELIEKGVVYAFETSLMKLNKSRLSIAVTAKSYEEKGMEFVDTVIEDISLRVKAEDRVYKLTYFDSLTSLPNKNKLLERIDFEMKKYKRKAHQGPNIFSLMCIGIDKFKNINNVYGIKSGDILLQAIAKTLTTIFRNDDLVTRYTGDKFIVFLSEMGNPQSIINIINKIFTSLNSPIKFGDTNIRLSFSCGVSIYPYDGDSPEILIKNCESALYTAKASGANSYHIYDKEIYNSLVQSIKVEEKLIKAIENDELLPFFQPKFNYKGQLVGMEALIRWISDGKIIPPFEFIPLSEKNGLINKIGRLVLIKSCKKQVEWQKKGYPPLRVSVNVSPIEFNQPELIDNIKNAIIDTGLDPQWLELEITESGLLYNEQESISKLEELHNLGISLSIDDFGTGYSSLSKLKDFPIDTVKIDKSFVDPLPGDKKARTISRTIIDLAHNLDFKVIAEGIENIDQLDFLEENHCDHYQGYYFSKPLNPDEFEDLLKSISSDNTINHSAGQLTYEI